MRFVDLVEQAADGNRSRLCIGLDPVPERIPSGDVLAWARAIIAATSDVACCYKPNSAFFEALGLHGWELLAEVIGAVPAGLPVLLDAKRGDIGNTAEAYARAAFEVLGAGAVTVSPYLGGDAIQPFLRYPERAAFVLCRTSNPGAGEFQDTPISSATGPRPLYELVAEHCRDWNREGNVGLVVGATYPAEIARVRALCPDQMLLVPSAPVEFQVGDVVRLRKQHPCGGFDWRVTRLGADIGLKCETCGRHVLLDRPTLERRLKSFVRRGVA